MNKKIFCMKDCKMGMFTTIFIENSPVNAVRGLEYILMNQEKSQISQYPEDFEMYYLGEIDPQTGKIDCPKSPEFIISANTCILEMRRRIEKAASSASVADLGSMTARLEKSLHTSVSSSENREHAEGSRKN